MSTTACKQLPADLGPLLCVSYRRIATTGDKRRHGRAQHRLNLSRTIYAGRHSTAHVLRLWAKPSAAHTARRQNPNFHAYRSPPSQNSLPRLSPHQIGHQAALRMWRHSSLVNCLISISGFLIELSYCVPISANQTVPAVNSRQKYGCFSYRPAHPALDRTAPVMECARALLQFPNNAPPGKSCPFNDSVYTSGAIAIRCPP